jgi:DNA end-binding protein Ku
MQPRANWKGYLKLGLVTCPAALFTAASESDRVRFNTLNRATGNRVRREFVDSETEKPVGREEQVKGYETGDDAYVVLEQDEIDAAIPESTKTIGIEAFIPCDDVDLKFIDKPYYLAPTTKAGEEAFAVIRAAMAAESVAGLARTVLFRRERVLLLRPHDSGLLASTLHYDYEMRDETEIFEDIPKLKLAGEMLDLAKHIIKTKRGKFDPRAFDDRYEEALVEVIRAKQAGTPIKKAPPRKDEKVVDLLDALRRSAGRTAAAEEAPAKKAVSKNPAAKRKAKAKTPPPRRSTITRKAG